jgi:hypothetical protein
VAKALFKLPNFNAVIAEYDAKKSELDDVAHECIEAAQSIQYNAMLEGLSRHRRTGAAMDSLQKNPIQREVNRTFSETGITLEGSRAASMEGFWAAWFQEYGAARKGSGKVLFKKDPWFRPAIDDSKSLIEKFWRAIFDKRGYPMK